MPELVIQVKFKEPRALSERVHGKLPTSILSHSFSSNKNRLDDTRLGMINCEVLGGSRLLAFVPGLNNYHIALQVILDTWRIEAPTNHSNS